MLKKIKAQRQDDARAHRYRELIRKEAVIGGKLFGPIPAGHKRDFFCLDQHTWVWHEEWVDRAGIRQSKTTHYSVRPSGVVKIQNGSNVYQSLSPTEARNFQQAVKLYVAQINKLYANFA